MNTARYDVFRQLRQDRATGSGRMVHGEPDKVPKDKEDDKPVPPVKKPKE